MTIIGVSLMNLYSNCHKHKNYQNKWQKDRFKSKSETWNKGIKILTQMLKPKIQYVQDQNIYIFYSNEVNKRKFHKNNKIRV